MTDLIERTRLTAKILRWMEAAALAAIVEEAADAIEELQVYAERYRWVRDHDNAFLLSEDVIDDQIAINRARGEE